MLNSLGTIKMMINKTIAPTTTTMPIASNRVSHLSVTLARFRVNSIPMETFSSSLESRSNAPSFSDRSKVFLLDHFITSVRQSDIVAASTDGYVSDPFQWHLIVLLNMAK